MSDVYYCPICDAECSSGDLSYNEGLGMDACPSCGSIEIDTKDGFDFE